MTTQAQARQHRRDLQAVTGLAGADLDRMWQQIQGKTAEQTRDQLIEALTQLVGVYGPAAATLAADWYDDMRDASDARGRFTAIPAELPDAEGTVIVARWAAGPLFSAEPDQEAALARAGAGVQKMVADADRGTVLGSLRQDRSARGYQRVTSGEGCDFCRMLAGRGAVYSATTADFRSHDHCHCIAVPAFGA